MLGVSFSYRLRSFSQRFPSLGISVRRLSGKTPHEVKGATDVPKVISHEKPVDISSPPVFRPAPSVGENFAYSSFGTVVKYTGLAAFLVGVVVTGGVYRSGTDQHFRSQFEKRVPYASHVNSLVHGVKKEDSSSSQKDLGGRYSSQIAAEKLRILREEEASKLVVTPSKFDLKDDSSNSISSDSVQKPILSKECPPLESPALIHKPQEKVAAIPLDLSSYSVITKDDIEPTEKEELYLGDPNYGLVEEDSPKVDKTLKKNKKSLNSNPGTLSSPPSTPSKLSKDPQINGASQSTVSPSETPKAEMAIKKNLVNSSIRNQEENISKLKKMGEDVKNSLNEEVQAELDFSRLNIDKIKQEILGHNDPITAAIQRVEILVDQLKTQRTNESDRLKNVIERQTALGEEKFLKLMKEREENYLGKVEEELEKLKSELNKLKEEEIAALEIKNAEEHQRNLKREADMHDSHLKSELNKQRNQLDQKWETDLRLRLGQERSQRMFVLESLFVRLKAIETVLYSRETHEKMLRKGHKLWLASEAFGKALYNGQPLLSDIEGMRSAADGDPLVTVCLDSLRKSVVENGFCTMETLRNRFAILKIMCGRAAQVDDDGGMLSHLASTLVYMFSFERSGLVSGSDVASILSRAEYYLNVGNLDLAAREVNSLRGWPKRLAKDWLEEARSHLEAVQAVEVIKTHVCLNSIRVS